MSTQKHTPGPWVYTDDGYVTAGEVYVHEPNNLGREIVEGEIIPAEVLANARLIAAAPALLAAAAAMASVLRNFTMYDGKISDNLVILAREAMKQYLAAIAAAEGRME